jgi:hypothetical protein
MISVEELFKDSNYPKWIAKHPGFSKIEYIRKIFSTIGLPNFEEKHTIDNTREIIVFANQLLDLIADSLNARIGRLVKFSEKAKIGKKRREKLTLILAVMNSLNTQLRQDIKQFITPHDSGKISLNLPNDIVHGDEVFMKKGASLFKVYEKISTLLKDNKFLALEDLTKKYQFKNFSSINLPSKNATIKFSAEGADGIWDIATMSMRGIHSCQTWDHGYGNSSRIIGSIIDPFTAVIYITSGENLNQYGSKMMRRCVVRYAIEQTTKEPFLLLEKMYPAFDKPSLDTFIKTLQTKAPHIAIKYSGNMGGQASNTGSALRNVYIPLSDELKMVDVQYYPYVDSAITFREDTDCKLAKNTPAVHALFKRKIPALFQKAILSRVFTRKYVKDFGAAAVATMAKLRKKPTEEVQEGVKSSKTNNALIELSNRFADFVCAKSPESDPFDFMEISKYDKHCTDFFKSEFTASVEFAQVVAINVFEYIAEKSK